MRKKLPQTKFFRIAMCFILAIVIIFASFGMPAAPAAVAQDIPSAVGPDGSGGMWLNTVTKHNGTHQVGGRVFGPVAHAHLAFYSDNGVLLQEFTDINLAAGASAEFWLDQSVSIVPGQNIWFVLTHNGVVISNIHTKVQGPTDLNNIAIKVEYKQCAKLFFTPFDDPKLTVEIPQLGLNKVFDHVGIEKRVVWIIPAEQTWLLGQAPEYVDVYVKAEHPEGAALTTELTAKIPGKFFECKLPPTATPVPTQTNTPVPTATSTATPTSSPTGTNTPLPTATNTATSSPTNTPSSTASSTATASPTNTPPPTATATATSTPVPSNGIARLTKIAVVESMNGVYVFLAPGWPMTITTESGVVVVVTATEANGTVEVSLPPGRYVVKEAVLPGWHAEIADTVTFDVKAGEVSQIVFKNKELHPSIERLYLPLVCMQKDQATPVPTTTPEPSPTPANGCPIIRVQSGSRPEDSGFSPGTGPESALVVRLNGSFSKALWKVYEVETRRVLYLNTLTCANGLCETEPIYGTEIDPRPAPNTILLITVQLYDANGNPVEVCARVIWIDPPGDGLSAASPSGDKLADFLKAVALLQ